MKIGVDVDGTIIDYMKTVRAYAELHDMDILKKDGVTNRQGFYIRDRYNWTKEEVKAFGDKFFVALTEQAPVYALAPEMLKRLHDDGHELYIISNRIIIGEAHTVEMEKVFEKYNMNFNGRLWTADKLNTCLKNKIEIMIDDDSKVAKDCAENGITCIFMREKDTPKVEHPLVYEVDCWPEVYRVINKLQTK